ncbi:hypothetical protein CFK38_04650 [Brachybacterium vulturis]|uniref:Uncharacterized protein n=1 Tax=Brachybacterium vulturis TaxID=2017484 RepID=A0A291GL08_9MICO|nr:hypothetical protein CFK38_04650 [Brachybacterium vulturis]
MPDTMRLPGRTFEAEGGSTYLVEFEATALKPEGSPGSAMYFGASLACGGPDGGTIRSVGGTQNVRSGERVTIRNQFLLDADRSGNYACRVSFSSPSDEAAAAGTTATIDSTWSVAPARSEAVEVPADERLPRLVQPGERAAVFRAERETSDAWGDHSDLLSTVHVTSCTMVNGSTEDGRTWCPEDQVDPAGSAVELTYRLVSIDGNGEVCDSRTIDVEDARIERLTHHLVLHGDAPIAHPADACGTRLRFVVALENEGPAPLVIHRSNSTFVMNTGE